MSVPKPLRRLPRALWLGGSLALLAGLGVLLALAPRPVAAQDDLQISIVAYVDVFPASDPNCPGCDGNFDIEDQDYAATNPLPPMTFAVFDDTGAELGRQDTAELTVGIQRTVFDVPDGPEFTVELVSGPPDWQLCPNETTRRVIPADDFQLGVARETFHFTQGCNVEQETPTPEPGQETPTPEPGQATATPAVRPTDKPSNGNGNGGKSGPALGTIRGFACIDLNGNGKVDPDDPGLNDVRVHLAGGGIERSTLTPGTGSFSFDGLGAGTYDVYIQPGPEWHVTTPARYTVQLAAGQVALGNDFCMRRGTGPAAGKAQAAMKLPATGLVNLPVGGLLGAATLLLGALGALGMATERRRR
jgi:hypothetical protein